MLIVPGQAGEIGVLARHAPLVATLKAGSTRVHLGGTEVLEFATGPGFFKVETDRALALVDDAVNVKEIDDARATAQLEAAKAELEKLDAGRARATAGSSSSASGTPRTSSPCPAARPADRSGDYERVRRRCLRRAAASPRARSRCTLTLDLVEERGDPVERAAWRLATGLDRRERHRRRRRLEVSRPPHRRENDRC